jgi:RNA polymerase sigma-70 factor (ECF subfamily)
MPTTAATDVTRILRQISRGDRSALDRLMPLVYDELRVIAGRHMARENPGHTLQPTALVNEAVLRLIGADQIDCRSRAHFLAVASTTIRRVLVDYARGRRAAKRAGGQRPLTLIEGAVHRSIPGPVDFMDLDHALNELAALNERRARIVELRVFGGLGVEEAAQVLAVSETTIKAEWRFALAWLRARLES